MISSLNTTFFLLVMGALSLSCKTRGRSSLQADGQRTTLSAREMNWAFLSRFPKVWGQDNFFYRAQTDPSFANAHAQVVESDPALRKVAEEGLALWAEYRRALSEDFAEDNVSTVLDPDSATIRSLFALQPETTGQFAKISLLELRTLAWDKARKFAPASLAEVHSPSELSSIFDRFELPAEKKEAGGETYSTEQIRSALKQAPETRDLSESDVKSYVNTIQDAAALQNRYERALFSLADDESTLFAEKRIELQEWLDYRMSKTLELMNANCQALNRRENLLRQSVKDKHPDIDGLLDNVNGRILSGSLISYPNAKGNVRNYQQVLKTRPSTMKNLLNSKNWPTEDQKIFADRLADVEGRSESVMDIDYIGFKSKSWSKGYNYDYVAQPWNRIVTMTVSANLEISNTLSLYLSQAGERHNSLARTFKVLSDAKKSLLAMQGLSNHQQQNFISSLVQKIVRGLIDNQENPRKFQTYPYKNWTETLRSAGLVERTPNLVDGIYLRGLFEGVRYWSFRDLLALSNKGTNLNDFLTGRARAGSPTLASIQGHWLSQSASNAVRKSLKYGKTIGKISLPIVLFAAMVANPWRLDSLVKSFRDWKNGVTPVYVDTNPPWRSGSGPNKDSPFSGFERSSPRNVDLSGSGEENPRLYFKPSDVPLTAIPNYVNFAFPEHALERNYNIEYVDVDSGGYKDFSVSSAQPVLAQDHGLSLPSFSNQKIEWVELYVDGRRVQERDYRVRLNKDLNLYWIEFASDEYEGSQFDYEVAYDRLYLPPPDPNYFKIPTNLTLKENREIQNRGFHSLSASIRELVDPKAAETPLYKLADAYASGAVYTAKPESFGFFNMFLPSHYTNNYLKFLQDGCLYYQCSASNTFFVDFVQKIQAESSESTFKIEAIAGYHRDANQENVTAADAHLHSVAYAQQGGILELDATPSAADESMKSSEIKEAAKKEASRPRSKRAKIPTHHLHFEINVWTPIYEERFRRASEIASATQDAKETLSTYGEYPKYFFTIDTQDIDTLPSDKVDVLTIEEPKVVAETFEVVTTRKPGELTQEEKEAIERLKLQVAAIDKTWKDFIHLPQIKKLINQHGASEGVFHRLAILINAYKAYLAGYLDLNSYRNLLVTRGILKSASTSLDQNALGMFQLAVKNIGEKDYLRPLLEDTTKPQSPKNNELTANRILDLQKTLTSFGGGVLRIQAQPLPSGLKNFVSPCITINLPGVISQ